ncbi:MAG: hypothetical protein CBB60_009470 [Armatimonadetes bacterium Cent15-Ar3]|jgi:MraZ protein|nr:MAG: hypothetical protein CBB60_009470 [Armatimonadetes bacterium Cent15-Ar3]
MSKKPAPARSSINLNEPCSVDAKGRVLLTKELKEAFVGEVKLVQDIQKFIRVYAKEVFEEEEQIIRETFSRGNRSASKYRMAYLSNAREAKVDTAGRLLIPADFRAWIGISNKCVMIANGEEFLIMSPSDYEAWQKSPSTFRAQEAKELDSLRKDAYDEERTIRELRSGVSK